MACFMNAMSDFGVSALISSRMFSLSGLIVRGFLFIPYLSDNPTERSREPSNQETVEAIQMQNLSKLFCFQRSDLKVS